MEMEEGRETCMGGLEGGSDPRGDIGRKRRPQRASEQSPSQMYIIIIIMVMGGEPRQAWLQRKTYNPE